jgi:hypothetical protein
MALQKNVEKPTHRKSINNIRKRQSMFFGHNAKMNVITHSDQGQDRQEKREGGTWTV